MYVTIVPIYFFKYHSWRESKRGELILRFPRRQSDTFLLTGGWGHSTIHHHHLWSGTHDLSLICPADSKELIGGVSGNHTHIQKQAIASRETLGWGTWTVLFRWQDTTGVTCTLTDQDPTVCIYTNDIKHAVTFSSVAHSGRNRSWLWPRFLSNWRGQGYSDVCVSTYYIGNSFPWIHPDTRRSSWPQGLCRSHHFCKAQLHIHWCLRKKENRKTTVDFKSLDTGSFGAF